MSAWTPKPGCPDTLIRLFNGGEYAGIGPNIYAELTRAEGRLWWNLFIEDAPRRRGGREARRIAGGTLADIPPALATLKARIARLAMAHVRAQLDHAIATTIEALAVTVAEHEGIAAAAADLDLADAHALVHWDRERERAEAAREAAADRLARLTALAPTWL